MINIPKEKIWRVHCWPGVLCSLLCVFSLVAISPMAFAAATVQESFASPEDGFTALAEAVRSNNQPMLHKILSPHGSKLTNSGDAVADERGRNAFIKAYDEASKIVLKSDTQATLMVGKDEWPLPILLVKSRHTWRFDTKQGEKEILKRRIGRNELAAIQVCLAIVDAEREYVAQDPDANGIPEYAQKFMSTAGKRDGLYWETKPDEPLSPLGPLLATAASEGYRRTDSMPLAPYHGYFYKMLTAQGKDAADGAHDYIIRGKMIGGFAVIAYPASYGSSGVMSFIVNQDGVVYEKNLGVNTMAIASKMTTYNPGAGWKRP